ncbi:hypothetical protein Phou_091580 [Phytohabitans houttuyneae]|uniref:LysM domain-containing protein n=1 Tax=Phytohabitans houttuyneae TaxID=1076126 RepID=A0A6V8KQT6_9ACTN|nr:hypothetical protein Phou_091580 [Phytohabitans houttuyneae]
MRRSAPIDGWTVLLLVGIPVVLVRLVGWPWPHRMPSRTDLAAWVAEPLADRSITATVVALIWLTWLILVAIAAVEACRWVIRRRRLPRLQVPQPAQVLTATLMGAAAVSSTDTAVADTGSPAVTLTDNLLTATSVRDTTAVRQAPMTVHVGATSYRYVVKPKDTLSSIARQWLGSPDRWPEICRLNRHRHFPTVGGTLRDCDLIYPGWDLRLPADATPPAAAVPAQPPRPAAPPPDPAGPRNSDGIGHPTPAPHTSASNTPGPPLQHRPRRRQTPRHAVPRPVTPTPSRSATAATRLGSRCRSRGGSASAWPPLSRPSQPSCACSGAAAPS